uniref:Uncharacterized protein n=1 Tax=Setaria viridis TaxID=4556 RepID=A0A4U6UHS6_SETVI|nr:hypothetical protein SEVIR_5G090100v2 [Setaria viridis]TKW13289.1 hypothetical protein SEVIR_5G090100v2 [Setaria viridis]
MENHSTESEEDTFSNSKFFNSFQRIISSRITSFGKNKKLFNLQQIIWKLRQTHTNFGSGDQKPQKQRVEPPSTPPATLPPLSHGAVAIEFDDHGWMPGWS